MPFVGQKRLFVNLFIDLLKENIPADGAGWTVVDAFGGSGLLAHAAKHTLPEARVIYNDFDGFARRIALIPTANALRRELYAITQDLPKKGRIADTDKARMLAVVGRYPPLSAAGADRGKLV